MTAAAIHRSSPLAIDWEAQIGRLIVPKEKIARVAALGDRINAELFTQDYNDAPGPVKIVVKDGPNLAFSGWEVADYSTNADRPRWVELKLWVTVDLNVVAGRARHSNIAGEETFWTAAQVDTIEDVMNLWQWDMVAKAFARVLKWDVTRHVP
jgi:hypothetical protein